MPHVVVRAVIVSGTMGDLHGVSTSNGDSSGDSTETASEDGSVLLYGIVGRRAIGLQDLGEEDWVRI